MASGTDGGGRERGVGKTVLLNRVDRIAREVGYRTRMIDAQEQKGLPDLLVPHLRRTLLDLDRMGAIADQAKKALRVFKSFMSHVRLRYENAELSLDIDPEIGSAGSGYMDADLTAVFVAVGEAARGRETAVGILIDEIQSLTEPHLAARIMAMHRINQLGLPIFFAATGLPQVVGLTGDAKSYAERLFDFPRVDALSEDDTTEVLQRPAVASGAVREEGALARTRAITCGYPCFLREWGYHTWNRAAGPRITEQGGRTRRRRRLPAWTRVSSAPVMTG